MCSPEYAGPPSLTQTLLCLVRKTVVLEEETEIIMMIRFPFNRVGRSIDTPRVNVSQTPSMSGFNIAVSDKIFSTTSFRTKSKGEKYLLKFLSYMKPKIFILMCLVQRRPVG